MEDICIKAVTIGTQTEDEDWNHSNFELDSSFSKKASNERIIELTDKVAVIERQLGIALEEKRKVHEKINKLYQAKEEMNRKIQSITTYEFNSDWMQYTKESYEWDKKVMTILKTTFGFSEFKPCQLAAINALLNKKDVIALLPTGGGKSLCYQLPSLMNQGVTLVVSPLIALIDDQIRHLTDVGISAKKISQAVLAAEKTAVFAALNGKSPLNFKLLYCTPESLVQSKRLMSALQKCYNLKKLCLIAIDEVHCISEWGHDFRKDYLQLGQLKQLFPDVPLIGLSATATTKVVDDTIKNLDIPNALLIKGSFLRKNLFYRVAGKPTTKEAMIEKLVHIIDKQKDKNGVHHCGIIYASTIRDTDDIAIKLRERGCSVARYHADLTKEERSKMYDNWLKGKAKVIVATIAFGLGIDKQDVRYVVHVTIPKSLQALYQESGRAGRDGLPSKCILWYSFEDYLKLMSNSCSRAEKDNAREILIYSLEKIKCRHEFLVRQFNNADHSNGYDGVCESCDNCVSCDRSSSEVVYDLRPLYEEVRKVIKANPDTRFTMKKLLDAWKKTYKRDRTDNYAYEYVLGTLLARGYIELTFNYTPYATNTYIKLAERPPLSNRLLVTTRSRDMLNGLCKEHKSVEKSHSENARANTKSIPSGSGVRKRKFDDL